jgi:hypothetical protein
MEAPISVLEVAVPIGLYEPSSTSTPVTVTVESDSSHWTFFGLAAYVPPKYVTARFLEDEPPDIGDSVVVVVVGATVAVVAGTSVAGGSVVVVVVGATVAVVAGTSVARVCWTVVVVDWVPLVHAARATETAPIVTVARIRFHAVVRRINILPPIVLTYPELRLSGKITKLAEFSNNCRVRTHVHAFRGKPARVRLRLHAARAGSD